MHCIGAGTHASGKVFLFYAPVGQSLQISGLFNETLKNVCPFQQNHGKYLNKQLHIHQGHFL